jgi:hypothetical protein
LKYRDVVLTSTASTVAGAVWALSQDIIQGDSVSQRSGSQIFLQKIDLRLNAVLPALGLVGGLRVVLVADKRNTGSIPATTDILQAATATSPPNISAMLNKRFTYIYDEFLPMVVGGSDQQIHIQLSRKFNKVIGYNGTTAVATANGQNALFILVLTDLAANTPFYAFDVGLHYNDM